MWEKPKVVTENEPRMDEPTTTKVDNLGIKKTRRDPARCKILHVWLLNPKRNETSELDPTRPPANYEMIGKV